MSIDKTIQFLKSDVKKNGGSASQVIKLGDVLMHVNVCKVPWGTIVINKQITKLEAFMLSLLDVE